MRPERLRAERDAGHSSVARRSAASSGVTVSGFASTVSSSARGSASSKRAERDRVGERRRPAADEHRRESLREPGTLPLELVHEGVRVGGVLVDPPDRGDEVAVPAAVDAERQVDVEMPHGRRRQQGVGARGDVPAGAHRFLSPSRLRTARNASCGTSTPPTCFIRFLPFFCFSSSLRLREMSPP